MKKLLIELRSYINYRIRKFELLVLLSVLVSHTVWSQPEGPSAPFVEYKGLPTQANPGASSYKPLPVTLTDEDDFRVVRYPVDNPLQLKLSILNRKNRRWTLKIETGRQELLFLESKRTGWSWHLLNLQDLPVGQYRLVITIGPHQLVLPFVITPAQPVDRSYGLGVEVLCKATQNLLANQII